MLPTIAICLAVSAAPSTTYDRITDSTETVEEAKGMKLLTPYGVDFRVTSAGKGTSPVKASFFRVWETISSSGKPDGVVAASTSKGSLLVDGRRVDDLYCGPPETKPAGRFTTWFVDVHISQKGMKALPGASKLIEIACGSAVEKIDGASLKAFAAMAKLFLRSDYASTVTQEIRDADGNVKQDAFGDKPGPSPAAGSLASDMASARAKKYAKVASCLATAYEDDESSKEQIIKECKGYINSDGVLVFEK